MSYEKSTTIWILDVTPFLEGWLIRPGKCASIRLFRQTTVIYPHQHCFVWRKDLLREMMLKLNDVCVCHEQLVELLGVCVLLFFGIGELKKKKWLFRPPSRCCFYRRLLFCVVCYCCWNRCRSATVMLCWRLLVKSLAKWLSTGSEFFVCVQHLNARCLMEAEHFCSIVAVSIPFTIVWNSNNELVIVQKFFWWWEGNYPIIRLILWSKFIYAFCLREPRGIDSTR